MTWGAMQLYDGAGELVFQFYYKHKARSKNEKNSLDRRLVIVPALNRHAKTIDAGSASISFEVIHLFQYMIGSLLE